MAHANARLGPAGRRELVRLILMWGCLRGRRQPASRSRPAQRIGGSGAGLRRATGERSRARGRGSLKPSASFAAAHARGGRAAGLRGARAHGLGAAVDRRRDRCCALDGPRDPAASRLLARAAAGRARRSCATSGRARAICCTWTSSATRAFGGPGTPSPATARAPASTARQPARPRLLPRDRRRPLAPGLRRTARRREGRHRDRVPRTRPGLVCRPRHHRPAA